MVAGRLRHLICLFTCITVLLLWASPHDVEASSCQRVIHKKVGDTVELSSCLPTERVTVARWKYGDILITGDLVVSENHQFKDRLFLNPTTFSLTVRRLTVKDSGDFSFLSEVNDRRQRQTVTITLHVHETITKQPVLTSNSTWNASTKSCLVFLDCCATIDSSVTYSWTVGNQTIQSGSRLQHIIRGQDEETRFTCTIDNFVSNLSASETVKCSNTTQQRFIFSSIPPLIIWLITGILFIILLLFLLIFYTKSKDSCHNRLTQSQTVDQDKIQEQVYSSLLHGDCCVYETIRGSEDAGTGDAYESMKGCEEATIGP